MTLSDKILKQVGIFKKGFPDFILERSASVGDGILRLSQAKCDDYIRIYDESIVNVEKFVPASGAATRMFKEIHEIRNGKPRIGFEEEAIKLPFDLKGKSTDEVLSEILDEMQLDKKPKGILPFHQYPDGCRTPVEEHIVEAISYANKEEPIPLHFTVSFHHLEDFQELTYSLIEKYEEKLEITFSFQNEETDTIAVDLNFNPVIDEKGEHLTRPAGHGALLENLNSRNADLLFVKNIDNVVIERLQHVTTYYKKVIAGVLIDFQKRCFDLLERMDEGESVIEIAQKLLSEMGWKNVPENEIRNLLNRPIRVCGMVKNTGEPGGGPFWTNRGGTQNLQIVEGAQINKMDPKQVEIYNSSTHFNPTDLVCGIRNYKGEKFDLMRYRDEEAGIITEKTHGSEKIFALELPGLWNGSMAHWNSIFVEVPIETFNPVKSVFDLLRPEHQS